MQFFTVTPHVSGQLTKWTASNTQLIDQPYLLKGCISLQKEKIFDPMRHLGTDCSGKFNCERAAEFFRMPQPFDAYKHAVEARKSWLLMLECLVVFMTSRYLFQTSFVLPIWMHVWEGVGMGCIAMLVWSILHSTEAVHGQKTVWKLHPRRVLVAGQLPEMSAVGATNFPST